MGVQGGAVTQTPPQSRLGELQESRRGQEERVGALRAAKEAAEGPEKAAKEAQQRLWEGMEWGGGDGGGFSS